MASKRKLGDIIIGKDKIPLYFTTKDNGSVWNMTCSVERDNWKIPFGGVRKVFKEHFDVVDIEYGKNSAGWYSNDKKVVRLRVYVCVDDIEKMNKKLRMIAETEHKVREYDILYDKFKYKTMRLKLLKDLEEALSDLMVSNL